MITKSDQSQYLTILIVYRLAKQDANNEWILNQAQLIECLLKIWRSDRFHDKHRTTDQLDYIYWKEPIYLIKIFLKFHKAQLELSKQSKDNMEPPSNLYPVESNIELLFKLLIVFQYKSLQQYEFLRLFFKDIVAKVYTCEWKRATFFKFVKIFTNSNGSETTTNPEASTTKSEETGISTIKSGETTSNSAPTTSTTPTQGGTLTQASNMTPFKYTNRLKANILQYILIPCFQYCFENNQHVQLIGGPPQPETDSDTNLVSVFINKVVDPDNTGQQHDSVRIFLLQLSSLLVQYAHDYIHDVNNKKQGTKLRRLMTFAWPCLLAKNCVDPFNKYHGHLLLSHIISKFAIHKRIVLQVSLSFFYNRIVLGYLCLL